MRRKTFGALELSVIDEYDADTQYIYDEVFGSQLYHHPEMKIPDRPTIMDVGANIGIYAIWAHRRYRPAAICCYEASPRTFAFLEDNLERLADREVTDISAANCAIASRSGQKLVLQQSTSISGISTLLDPGAVNWIAQAAADRQLVTHEITSSTVSQRWSPPAALPTSSRSTSRLSGGVERHRPEGFLRITTSSWKSSPVGTGTA